MSTTDTATVDLATDSVRTLNAELHAPTASSYEVLHPRGAHAVAAGIHDGIAVHVRGQSETMFTSFQKLALGMLVAIVLVYLLLVTLFQSWIDPLIILFAVPGALSGVLWMLTATRTTLTD